MIPNPADVHLRDGLKSGTQQRKTDKNPTKTHVQKLVEKITDDQKVWGASEKNDLRRDVCAMWRIDRELMLRPAGKFTHGVIKKQWKS